MAGTVPVATFRITYQKYGELRDDMTQMTRGGLMVKVADVPGLGFDSPVALELVLPDGGSLATEGRVLHLFAGVGLAVSVGPELLEQVRQRSTGRDSGTGAAHHELVDPAAGGDVDADPDEAPAAAPQPGRARTSTAVPAVDSLTHAEKIQIALHGNRDQRNAILRDTNRTLHPYVLKNPQITTEDVLAMAKNAQVSPELLKQISERKDWFQRPQIALALARNPKTPPEVAVRALDHCPIEALRQIAKGTGAMPHVVQAARRKVVK